MGICPGVGGGCSRSDGRSAEVGGAEREGSPLRLVSETSFAGFLRLFQAPKSEIL